MGRKKRAKSKDGSYILKITAWFLAALALILISLAVGYFVGYDTAKEEIAKKEKRKEERRLALLQELEKNTTETENSVSKRLKEVLKKEQKKKPLSKKEEIAKVKSYASASHEYASAPLEEVPKRVKREEKRILSNKPRLAVIMDDVSTKSHVNAIKSLGLPLTMSFLPPSKDRPYSAKLASKENFYMVHLPMEAQGYFAEEPNTLRVSNSQSEILSRIRDIKNDFPKVKYINNHTGSKFTSNETAVNRLMYALNSYDISFVDSRTTGKTKVPNVMRNLGLKYVARDVFLDHKTEKDYIKNQIKSAIKIAKREGLAIAIGHPHANTILALYESKKLFKDVELVYINEVY